MKCLREGEGTGNQYSISWGRRLQKSRLLGLRETGLQSGSWVPKCHWLVHLPLELFLSLPGQSEQASMDLWNWDEASLQEVPPGNKLTGLGRLLWLGTNWMLGCKDAALLTPDAALTSLLPAEGAEFGFYFPEVALQGDAPITPMTAENCWTGGCWAGPPGCWGNGRGWAPRRHEGAAREAEGGMGGWPRSLSHCSHRP